MGKIPDHYALLHLCLQYHGQVWMSAYPWTYVWQKVRNFQQSHHIYRKSKVINKNCPAIQEMYLYVKNSFWLQSTIKLNTSILGLTLYLQKRKKKHIYELLIWFLFLHFNWEKSVSHERIFTTTRGTNLSNFLKWFSSNN